VKVEVEQLSGVKCKLSIEIPAKKVTEALDRAYQDLRRKVKLKGFRPGKVPRSILERYYGDRIQYEVTQTLIQESYPKSLEEKDLSPVSQPDIQDVQFRPGEDFRYTAVVEVKPRIDLQDYSDLSLEPREVHVTDEDVETRIQEIRERFATLEDVEEDRPVQEGDIVLVEHRALWQGKPVEQGAPKEQMLELRSDRTEETLLKALVGRRPGEEVEVPHTFPEDFPVKEAAGKEGSLQITIRKIQKKVLPELDDEFAKRLGPYEDLEDFKAKVRQDMEEAERERIRSEMNEALIQQLLDRHSFEVPEAMVEAQIQEMIQNTRRRLAAHGMTLEQTGQGPEQLRVRYRPTAEKAVRTSLLLEAIALKEGIQVTDDDLQKAFERIARRTGQEVDQVRRFYEDPAAKASLEESLLEEKTLDFLRQGATMEGTEG
jgi:trigger factor